MKRMILFVFCIIGSMIFFVNNVNAECSYQERKELLDKAKNLEMFFEPNVNDKYFTFNMYNLDNDLYVIIFNDKSDDIKEVHSYDLKDNKYSFVENNVDDIIVYTVKIYASKSGCYSNNVTSKRVVKKIINKFYGDDICKGIEDYFYCKPLLDSKFSISDSKVISNINEYREKSSIKETEDVNKKFGMDDLLEFMKKYWYVFVSILIIGIVIFIIVKINKKRGELV